MDAILAGINLGNNVIWTDEDGNWSPVGQETEQTLTGALIVEEAAKLAGRPITLEGMWLLRATVASLRATRTAGAQLLLRMTDGAEKTVMWRHSEESIESAPVYPTSDPEGADLMETVLRLMEV